MAGNRRSGKKPKPTAMKVLEGSFRKDRHGHEPQTSAQVWPTPPAHLSPRELELWQTLQGYCATWTTAGDGLAVHGVVALADRLFRNQEMQAETGARPIIGDGKGKVRESPLISQEIKLWRELSRYLGFMGLTPVDRAKMHASSEPSQAQNKWAGILK